MTVATGHYGRSVIKQQTLQVNRTTEFCTSAIAEMRVRNGMESVMDGFSADSKTKWLLLIRKSLHHLLLWSIWSKVSLRLSHSCNAHADLNFERQNARLLITLVISIWHDRHTLVLNHKEIGWRRELYPYDAVFSRSAPYHYRRRDYCSTGSVTARSANDKSIEIGNQNNIPNLTCNVIFEITDITNPTGEEMSMNSAHFRRLRMYMCFVCLFIFVSCVSSRRLCGRGV